MYGVLVFLIWYVIGIVSFVYWFTKDYDLTLGPELLLLFIVGYLGPLAFVLGWLIHGDNTKPIVLIKKKVKK